jgi:hypothetical protein
MNKREFNYAFKSQNRKTEKRELTWWTTVDLNSPAAAQELAQMPAQPRHHTPSNKKKKSFFFLSPASATATKPVDTVLVDDKYAPDAADDPRTSSNLSRV